jgi:hypothetical protein
VIFGELAFFPNVNQQEFIAAIHAGFHFVDVCFADSRSSVVHDFEEARRVLVGHGNSLIHSHEYPTKRFRTRLAVNRKTVILSSGEAGARDRTAAKSVAAVDEKYLYRMRL